VSTVPSRPLSRRTVARTSSSSKHALSCRLHDERVCRVHAPSPRLPGPKVCRVHASRTRLPGLRVGPRPRSPQSFLREERLREIRFPDSRSTPCRPVSQTTRRAPAMDPEAMNPFALAVARGIGRAHCTGRPYFEADLAGQLPSRRNRPHAWVARAMKPSLLAFGCPTRTRATSLHGAPALPALLRLPVSRAMKPHGGTGHSHNGTSPPPGCPNGRVALAARVACALEIPSTIRLPELSAASSFAQVARAMGSRSAARLPERPHAPHCADPLREVIVSARLPARRRRPHCTDAHAGGTPLRLGCPHRSVSSSRSHLRDERVAVRSAHRLVTQAISSSQRPADHAVSRVIGSPRARLIHLAVARLMNSPREARCAQLPARPYLLATSLTARLPA
jgi:hypothetical protein